MAPKSLFVLIALLQLVGGKPVLALEEESPTAMRFEKTLHFLSPENTDEQIAPGTYLVEAAGVDSLWLFQGEETVPHLIQAIPTTHEEALADPVVVILSEEDTQHLLFLLPDGKGLEASGSYSGIRSKRAGDRPTINSKERTSRIRSQLKVITQRPKQPRVQITQKLLYGDATIGIGEIMALFAA